MLLPNFPSPPDFPELARPRYAGRYLILLAFACLPSIAITQTLFLPPNLQPVVPGQPHGLIRGILVSDFTGDGILDVTTGGGNDSALRVFPGDGTGSFLPPIGGAAFPGTYPFAAPDINGDGLADLLMVAIGTVYPFLNTGGGAMAPQLPIPVPFTPISAINKANWLGGDLNADGTIEFAVVGQLHAGTYVLGAVLVYSYASGAFTLAFTHVMPAAITWPTLIAAGDFDGDGRLDLAYADGPGTALHILLQGQGLTFTEPPAPLSPVTLPGNSDPRRLLAGDVNADGLDDLVVLGFASPFAWTPRIWVFPGAGPSGFGAPALYDPPQFWPVPLTAPGLHDFEADGLPELLCTGNFSPGSGPNPPPEVYRLPSAGLPSGLMSIVPTATYLPSAGSTGPVSGLFFAGGDMDNDGDPDIVCFKEEAVTPNAHHVLAGTALNQSLRRPGCPGSAGPLVFGMGTPTPGNLGFFLSLSGALPGALAACGVSLYEAPTTSGACTIWPDFSHGQLILPQQSYGVINADGSGRAWIPVPLPAIPQLLGVTVHAQWIANDSSGSFSAFGSLWAASGSRRILMW